jgi:hypothetical protein
VHNREESSILRPVATGSIDLAKYVLQLSAVEAPAKGVGRQQLSRIALSQFLATVSPATLGFLCGLLSPHVEPDGYGLIHQGEEKRSGSLSQVHRAQSAWFPLVW